ncbi:16S rRNA (guanine(966)-N(2))-methyltransferase RsmD [Francisella frigiditurris]|uniref:Ribosomal RNA small subunit methyltransferase D n=1 Tax=Francisella frigiditurris TaxID=1542390 RepID=A0A1J0KT44_9GAMM|nr:16S rRNA (guanine(966)-N(2))-methyltransferase RsmD [Francisella frigiditurris]APC96822.1 16S rRNA (guanine(966)-N(2))-methyltransferase RsmD [Francisella frigiditurris]
MKTNTVRVISGKFKGRKLKFPDTQGLRPTSDQMKETIFNWLQPYIYDSICIDAFAGSGSLGIEAISRGAKKAIFYEINFKALNQIKENLQTLNILNADIHKIDFLKAILELNTNNNNYIIFLDPPFNKGLSEKALNAITINEQISNSTLIYLEIEKEAHLNLEDSFNIIKFKKSGNVTSYLLTKK